MGKWKNSHQCGGVEEKLMYKVCPLCVSTLSTLSVELWLSSNKAISLWRLIVPITKDEKQTVPSLWLHQVEEFATCWLVTDNFHLYRKTLKEREKKGCMWSWATSGVGVRQMLVSLGPHARTTPKVGLVRQYNNGYCSVTQSRTCLDVI